MAGWKPSGSFGVVIRHFWALAILVTFVNATIMNARIQADAAQHPERLRRYRRVINGYFFGGVAPWLVMGVGVVFGDVPGLFAYLDPKNGPYVIAWYVTLALLMTGLGTWVFFLRGAEQLVELPGLFKTPPDLRLVQIYFLVMLVAGAIGLTFLFLGRFTVPSGP